MLKLTLLKLTVLRLPFLKLDVKDNLRTFQTLQPPNSEFASAKIAQAELARASFAVAHIGKWAFRSFASLGPFYMGEVSLFVLPV